MNTSIIIDDIRKRSVRLQRDKILEQIRQEEDMEAMSIPKQIILEVEERAKERVNSQGWKKTALFTVFLGAVAYLVYKYVSREIKPRLIEHIRPELVSMSIQTDTPDEDVTPRKVCFQLYDKEDEFYKTYPDTNIECYVKNYTSEWLINKSSGSEMIIDFMDLEGGHAVDFIPKDMLKYPNDKFDNQDDFELSIYERELKRELCARRSIKYDIIVMNDVL